MIFSKDASMTTDLLLRLLVGAILLSLVVLVRIVLVYSEIRRNRQRCGGVSYKKPLSTLIVLGSGGHTTEMLFMTKHLHPAHYHPIHYCKASTDSTSHDRVHTMIQEANNSNKNKTTERDAIHIHDIPRSREVGQSYFSSFFSSVYAFVFAVVLVGRLRPKLILCNGPGTCIPICLAALLYRMTGICYSNIVFIESYCRVQSLSLTGKLLYYAADLFVVHWKELHQKYPDSVLTTTFIQQ
jgi:beta-1,4-N-acetylglucosaminyltransferase